MLTWIESAVQRYNLTTIMLEQFIISVYSSSSVLVAIVCLLVVYMYPRRQKGVPKGPFRFPVIGNLPALAGRDVMGRFSKLREQYGDVYGLYMGGDLTIILNGYDIIHDALVKKGNLFSVRPRTGFHGLVFNNPAIVFANESVWKEQRQFAFMAMSEFGYNWKVKSLEERINDEVVHFLERVGSYNKPFDIKPSVNLSVANVIAGILFGERCNYNDPKFRACLDSVSEAARLFARSSLLMSCFPILQYLPGDLIGLNKIKTIRKHPKAFLEKPLSDHMKDFNEDIIEDVLDLYIKEIRDNETNNKGNTFCVGKLEALMGELVSAGSETTATCIVWFIMYMLRHPGIQERIQSDIDDIIGRERMPSLDDRTRLPYLEATILEVMRIEPVAPLSVPHAVHQDVTFKGYYIPQDTTVLVNLHSVLKDPKLWPEPDVFKPERFLDDTGRVKVPVEMIPFSIGRRACLGESLARMELFLYTVSLLQKYKFSIPDGSPPPSLEGHLGMTYSPKPYDISVTTR